MKQGNWAQNPLVLGQSGESVVRVAALEALGMPRRTVYRRCLPGGPWRRLLPGIVMLAPGEPSDRQRLAAALLRGGKDTRVTGLWAARLHGLRRTPEPGEIHILVPNERELTSVGFVTVERTIRLPRAITRDGVPLAPIHRAVLDAARRMRDFDTIRAMLAEAVQRGRCSAHALARELEVGSQRGSALPRRALTELFGGAHSVAEGDGLWLWRRSGLPEPERNVAIYDAEDRYIATPDAWCDDVGFAWEVDSHEFHAELDGYAQTLARNARYAAAGVIVLQTLPSRIRREPQAVIEELRAAYAAACKRPRPAVRMAA